MYQQIEQFEKGTPATGERSEASMQAEKRIQQANDLPRYQAQGDGSYQRHFTDRQGRDVTLRVEGNDAQGLAKVEGEQRLHSQHGIRLRAVDTAEAQTPPAYHGKGEMGRANLTLEIDRSADGAVVDRRLRLNDIQVNDNYRSRGIGGELLTEAERIGRQHQAREIYGNLVADAGQEAQVRRFYQEHGYQLRSGSGGEEVYNTLRSDDSDGASLRQAVTW